MQSNIASTREGMAGPRGGIMLTRADYRDLLPFAVASRHAGDICDQLAEKLETAIIVDATAIPPAVVTMNTEFEVRDEISGHVARLILVQPHDADIAAGRISVLTPVGAALLGLAKGDSARVVGPGGMEKRLSIVRVLTQPEAQARAGRLTAAG